MANILRGYGLAREQAHFKVEQEADVQRHRKRLEKEGRLPEEPAQAAAQGQGPPGEGFSASEHTYETLSEVLQQRARLDDPHALRRREFERRVKGEPPPLTEAELLRARSKLLAVGAAVGHVPRMSMGRDRWGAAAGGAGAGGDAALAGVRQLTPEAREVAARTYVAGVRALVYGSVLGALGLAAAGTLAVRSLGITSGDELAALLRGALEPLSAGVRGWLLPLKQRAEAWVGPTASVGGADGGGTSEFSRRMQDRYNPRKPPEETAVADGGAAP